MALGDDILNRLRAEVARRLSRCAAECAKDVKIVLSVAAPRRVAKGSGRVYATTPAIPGAPPRKLTGRGRASIAWRLEPGGASSVVGTNVIYMGVHERKDHKYFAPTLQRTRAKLDGILRGGAA